mgnify:FL=1
MYPLSIIKPLDPFEDIATRFIASLVFAKEDQLLLESSKETLDRSVISASEKYGLSVRLISHAEN